MSPAEPTLQPPASGVTVRMYNPGFGDCLLLAFRGFDGAARYLLLDCGVHHQYPGRVERLEKLALDIAAATGSHLHVVAATHEHTDHLYGFKYARDVFETIAIDDLWLAWTEDPTDSVALTLKQLYGLKIRALGAAAGQLRAAGQPLADRLQRVLDFEYPEALGATTGDKPAQLQYLRDKSTKKLHRSEDYRRPGETPLTLPGVPGVKVYVLGPPRDPKWIKSMEKQSELYPELTAASELAAFAAAALAAAGEGALDDDEKERLGRACPFDAPQVIAPAAAREHAAFGHFFQQSYGFSTAKGQGPRWRRIDTDWLAAAEQLALDINDKTNNTSLVLAVELTESTPRKVLLFAADAQAGNWLSWQTVAWPGEGVDAATVTAADLLKRTVLYKVGHHGSRNATLSRQGLEMMTSPDLVAMIPVDEHWANEAMEWEHPARTLLTKLKEKTRGRILRTDEIPTGAEPPAKPAEATEDEWGAFVEHVEWDRSPDKLWIQFTVPG